MTFGFEKLSGEGTGNASRHDEEERAFLISGPEKKLTTLGDR